MNPSRHSKRDIKLTEKRKAAVQAEKVKAKSKEDTGTSKTATSTGKKPAKAKNRSKQHKGKTATIPSDTESSQSSSDDHPAPAKKPRTQHKSSSALNLDKDGVEIVENKLGSGGVGDKDKTDSDDDGEGEGEEPDDLADVMHNDDALLGKCEELHGRVGTHSACMRATERLKSRWHSPVYAFFLPEVTLEVKNQRKCLVFVCAARGCGQELRRYLDTGDKSSSSNLYRHAKACWGKETVAEAKGTGDIEGVRNSIAVGLQRNGNIHDYFSAGKNVNAKPTYSHQQMGRRETRCVVHILSSSIGHGLSKRSASVAFVKWMCESLRPFSLAADRGFLELMKTGRPAYYIPSPSTVSRDVKIVFANTRSRLGKILRVSLDSKQAPVPDVTHDCCCDHLQAHPGRLSFATDAWTSPNHRALVAFIVFLTMNAQPTHFILDVVEVAKVCTYLLWKAWTQC